MPMYGPFTSVSRTPMSNGIRTVYDSSIRRTWYRQRPIAGPSPFLMKRGWTTVYPQGGNSPLPINLDNKDCLTGNPHMVYAHAQAWSNFVAQKGAAAEMAVNLLETKQAGQMLDKRLTQMYNFAKSVGEYRWGDAARHLGLKSTDKRFQKGRPPGVKRGAKHYANNILEYDFGWAPLASDISSAIEVIQRHPPKPLIRGRGYSSGSETVPAGGGLPPTRIGLSAGCLLQAELTISSPNLFLANQLGFVNAGSILWERVPYSFVVDWFSNVGQVIASFTDFYGCSLSKPFTTYLCTKSQIPLGVVNNNNSGYRLVSMQRTTSISGPSLFIRPFQGLSLTRGINAAALLVQQLKN